MNDTGSKRDMQNSSVAINLHDLNGTQIPYQSQNGGKAFVKPSKPSHSDKKASKLFEREEQEKSYLISKVLVKIML